MKERIMEKRRGLFPEWSEKAFPWRRGDFNHNNNTAGKGHSTWRELTMKVLKRKSLVYRRRRKKKRKVRMTRTQIKKS